MQSSNRIQVGRASRLRIRLGDREARERLGHLTREIARLRHVGHQLGEKMRPKLAAIAHKKADELNREADQITAQLFHKGPVHRPYATNLERVQRAATRLINQEIDAAYWRDDNLLELARDKADEAYASLGKNTKRRFF